MKKNVTHFWQNVADSALSLIDLFLSPISRSHGGPIKIELYHKQFKMRKVSHKGDR